MCFEVPCSCVVFATEELRDIFHYAIGQLDRLDSDSTVEPKHLAQAPERSATDVDVHIGEIYAHPEAAGVIRLVEGPVLLRSRQLLWWVCTL